METMGMSEPDPMLDAEYRLGMIGVYMALTQLLDHASKFDDASQVQIQAIRDTRQHVRDRLAPYLPEGVEVEATVQ